MPTMQYDTKVLDHGYDVSKSMVDVIQKAERIIDEDKVQFDQRIKDYYSSQFKAIESIDMVSDVNKTKDFSNWLSEKISELKSTIGETNNMDIGADTSGFGSGEYYPGSGTTGAGDLTQGDSSTFLNGVSSDVIDSLKEKLRDLGYTDEEIDKIIHGQMPVDQLSFDKLFGSLEGLGENGKAFYEKLGNLLGCSIIGEDGKLNQDLFVIAMLMAQKGLGMDINMADGSQFKNYITNIAIKLEELYKSDPSVRDKIKEKYGIDIFNEDGTIDLNKLALIKILDGMNMNDDYDLEKMLGIMVPTTTPISVPTDPETPTPADPDPIPTVPEGPTTPVIYGPPVPPTSAPTSPETGSPVSPSPSPVSPSDPYTPTDPTTPETSHGGELIEDDKNSLLDAAASAKAGLGEDMLKALENGAGFISKKLGELKPSIATAKVVKTKGANVGVIAAASLVAGGAATGGGVLISKKFKLTTFTPDNWNGLMPETQDTIETLMRNVGFTNDEIDKFESSTFSIPTEELNEHVSNVSNAAKSSEEIEEILREQYGYEIVDGSGNVDQYLLFVTMIIDGKGYDDNYNIYNVLRMNTDKEYSNSYDGISMEEYIDESESAPEKDFELEEDLAFDTYSDNVVEEVDTSVAKSAAMAIKNMNEAGFNNNTDANVGGDSTLEEF